MAGIPGVGVGVGVEAEGGGGTPYMRLVGIGKLCGIAPSFSTCCRI